MPAPLAVAALAVLLTGWGGGQAAWAAFGASTASGANAVATDTLDAPSALAVGTCAAGTGPVVVGSASAPLLGGGSLPLTVPVATQAGDLLVVTVSGDNSLTTVPPGLTELQADPSSTKYTSHLYVRFATSGDAGATLTWQTSGQAAAGVVVIRGAAGLPVVTDTASQGAQPNSTAVVSPSVAGSAGDLLLTLSAIKTDATFTPPTGMTARYGLAQSSISVASATMLLAATGPTGARTATASQQGSWTGQSIVVRAATTPSVVATTTADSAGTTALSLTVPSGVVAGDVLVVHVTDEDKGTSSPVTPPAGWSLVIETIFPGKAVAQVWQREAGASESGAVHQWQTPGKKAAAALLVLRGAAVIDPAGAVGGYGPQGTTVSAPSTTVATSGSLLLSLFATTKTPQTFTTPTGMTAVVTRASAFEGAVGVMREAWATAGTTGTRTSTLTTAAEAIGQSLVVAPRAAGVVTLTWGASPDAYATGYEVRRDGVLLGSVAGRLVTSLADSGAGGTRTYTVTSTAGTWRSAAGSLTTAVACP